MSPRDEKKPGPDPCARIVAAVFGSAFLIALLAVPVTTTTISDRAEPGTLLVIRTTYPRNTTMSLPRYLSARVRSGESGAIRLRSAKWTVTMAVIIILGVFDYFVICRLLRRPRRGEDGGTGPDDPDAGSGSESRPSGFSLRL